MKVWITKYALSKGIIETEVLSQNLGITFFSNGMYLSTDLSGRHWHESREEALRIAEEMRRKKIYKLKKQIEKLEKMRFE